MFKLPKIFIQHLMIKGAGFIFLISVIFSLVVPSVISAKDKSFTLLPKNEIISADYFAASETVTLSGEVEGDAYIGGGDLLVVGGNVTLDGEVGQNVRVLGGTVNISGKVGRNVSLAGGNISLAKNAEIAGNLVGAVGNLDYLGFVKGNLELVGQYLNLNGRVDRNVEAKVGSLTLGDNAQIGGNLSYASKTEANFAPNAQIAGVVTYKQTDGYPFSALSEKNSQQAAQRIWGGVRKGFSLVSFITAFLIGFIVLRLFPRRMLTMTEIFAHAPGKSLAIGFLTLVVIPIISLLLAFTIIGLPLSFIMMTVWVIIIYFTKITLAFYLGRLLLLKIGFGRRGGWALLLGLFIYFIAGGLPFIGLLLKLLVLFAGTGAIVTDIYRLYRSPSLRRIL